MQVDDEIAHQRIVDRTLCGALPSRVRRLIVGKDADDVERVEVSEFVAVEFFEFAAENEMQKLGISIRRRCALGHGRTG